MTLHCLLLALGLAFAGIGVWLIWLASQDDKPRRGDEDYDEEDR
jgi:hypothetical protein